MELEQLSPHSIELVLVRKDLNDIARPQLAEAILAQAFDVAGLEVATSADSGLMSKRILNSICS